MTHRISNGRSRSRTLVAIALLALAGPASAHAETVSDWNAHAVDALVVGAGQPPALAVMNLAMMHGAVYDAVNAIDGRYQPYLETPRSPRRYSKEAAAATAAYRVLAAGLPAQQAQLEGRYLTALAGLPAGTAKDGGVAVGNAAAAAMMAARANDGRGGPYRFPVGFGPGQWRPLPPGFVNDPLAWLAQLRPFLLKSPAQFRSAGPRALTSVEYASDFAEVKTFGGLTSSRRTARQTQIARFWSEHPVTLWNRVFRQLSARHRLDTAARSRFFATLYLTAIDALITCHNDKARWLFWRPVTAIHEAADDANPATDPDPAWLPLTATPPFPEHPSAHACASGAIVSTLRDFFGTDRARFSTHSAVSGTTRSFTRFTQAIDEVIDARVYAGIHFRSANVQGARLGRRVARWRQRRYFQPARANPQRTRRTRTSELQQRQDSVP